MASENPTHLPPAAHIERYIVLRCPYKDCKWHTRHQGGFQEQVAHDIYHRHVEEEHRD